MNHIYKVIWNHAKHCYTVVSEITKNHSHSNKRVRSMTAVVAAAMMLTGFGGMAIEAANPANDDVNIAVGKGASTNTTMGNPVGLVSGYIAIGENAYAWNGGNPDGIGRKEAYLDFNQGAVKNSLFTKPKVTDGTKLAGAIAIGKNTMARTGSVMIGDHTYVGKLGDIEVDPANKMNLNNGVYSTTLGASSYNGGSMSAVTGAFSIISNKGTSTIYGTQNFGATIYGSLNSIESSSIESSSASIYSAGMANSVLGFGNRTQNTNASLVWGTGNEVTNSIKDVTFSTYWNKTSASDAQKEIIKAMQSSQYAGGSVMAIGGGNKANWAIYSQLLGVQNTLTGTETDVSKLTMINGYKNTVANAKNTTVIGSNNKANDVQATTVMGDNNDLTGNGNHVIGDNHKVTGKNNILIGNNKEQKTHSGSDSVIIGNNASAGNGSMVMGNKAHAGNTGIALGMNASAGDGQNLAIGYYANVSGATNSTALGYASKVEKRDILSSDGNDGVVSVGKSVGQSGEAGITRRIINVKAGVNDTDAVNVSQLKGVETIANKGWNLTTGVVTDATQVKPGDTVDFSGDKNISVSHKGTDVSIALKDTLTLGSNATDGYVTVDGVKGTVWAGHAVSAGNVNMDGDSGEITGLTNTTLNSKDFATTGRAATEEQLKLVKNQADSAATEASKHSKVVNGSNITVEETDQDGQKTYKVGLNKNLEGIESISNGDAKINLNDTGVVISKGKDKTFSITDTGMGMSVIGDDYVTRSIMVGKTGTVISGGLSVAGSKITNVAAGSEDTDAVNVGQLKGVETIANKGWNLTTGVVTDATQVKPGDTVDFSGDKNISVSHKGTDVSIALKDTLTLGSNATDGYVTVDGVKGTVWAGHAVSAGNVNMDGDSGEITGLTNTTLNSKDFATTGRAATEEQLKLVKNQADSAATEASKHSKVVNGSNITVEETDQDGQKTYKVGLNKNLEGIESISNGDAKINLNDTGVVISKGKDKTFSITDTGMGMSVIGDDYVTRSIMVGKNGTVISGGLSVAGSKITNVADGTDDTDAVNLGQLKEAVAAGNTDSHIKAGEYEVGTDNKVSMDIVDKDGKSTGETVTIKDVAKASDVGDVSKIAEDIKNKEGNTTVVDAVNNVNNKVGDLNYSKVEAGDIKDGDGATTAIGKLNQKLGDVEKTASAHSTVSTDDSGNISVVGTKNKETGSTDYKVSLNKDLKLESVTTGDKVSLTKDGLTADKTKVTGAGLSIGDKTYVSKDGLNANDQKVTNVAAGDISEKSTDAVNGSQLFATNQQVAQNAQSISKLGNRINKVGAGAAALAALHPLDFDPDDKWDFAAGYGNYNGENAAAIGAYYRPNEDTMFSVGGSFGNGENMVNAGVSLKLGQGNHVSTSKVAMAKEIKDLRKELEGLKSALLDVNAGKKLDTSKLQLFPDVPKNHWAYEYVSTLKGNGVLTGYPDGEFKGDRPMTRYEFATMLYKAMLEGATLSDKILKEFAPELERFTVDTVHQDKDGKPTVERVRTVKAEK